MPAASDGLFSSHRWCPIQIVLGVTKLGGFSASAFMFVGGRGGPVNTWADRVQSMQAG